MVCLFLRAEVAAAHSSDEADQRLASQLDLIRHEDLLTATMIVPPGSSLGVSNARRIEADPRPICRYVQGHVESSRAIVLQCNTMAEGLDWLPEDGVVLTRADLER
ncbi:MAG: hypothetical protein AB7Q27_25120, partial [Acidimicrobiia bacterium]